MPRTARRHKGEGSIYARRDASGVVIRYEASVELDATADGKRQRKVVVGKTQGDVQKKLRTLQRAKEDKTISTDKTTVQRLIERWLELDVYPHLRPSTAHGYTQIAYDYLIPALGKQIAANLSRAQVQLFINNLVDDARVPAQNTLRNVRNVLRQVYNAGIRWGEYTNNPAKGIRIPRTARPQQDIAPLTLEQARVLLAIIQGHRFELLFRVALSLGLRLGELVALRWCDIDFVNKTLRVNGSMRRQRPNPKKAGKVGKTVQPTTLARNDPKTKQSKRSITIPPHILATLAQYQQEYDAIRRDVDSSFNPDGYVFCSEVGTPMEPRNINREFDAVVVRAELPASTRFHDLRHSCATLLIAQGVHLSVIKDILGHTQISTTANLYGHVYEEVQRDATTALDALLATPMTLELPSRKETATGQKRSSFALADSLADSQKETP